MWATYYTHVFHWFIHSHIHPCFVVLERPEDLNNELFFKNKTKTSATGKEMILVPLWYGYVVSGFGWYYNYLSSSPKSSCIKRLLKLWHKFVTESKFFYIIHNNYVFSFGSSKKVLTLYFLATLAKKRIAPKRLA